MTKILFLVLIVCTSTLVQGQTQWIPGYIVTVSGDTLRGMIADQNAEWKRGEVLFKANGSIETKYDVFLALSQNVDGRVLLNSTGLLFFYTFAKDR